MSQKMLLWIFVPATIILLVVVGFLASNRKLAVDLNKSDAAFPFGSSSDLNYGTCATWADTTWKNCLSFAKAVGSGTGGCDAQYDSNSGMCYSMNKK